MAKQTLETLAGLRNKKDDACTRSLIKPNQASTRKWNLYISVNENHYSMMCFTKQVSTRTQTIRNKRRHNFL